MTTPAAGSGSTPPATPASPKRAYAAPRLTVHGTVAELTAAQGADVLVVSRLIGG